MFWIQSQTVMIRAYSTSRRHCIVAGSNVYFCQINVWQDARVFWCKQVLPCGSMPTACTAPRVETTRIQESIAFLLTTVLFRHTYINLVMKPRCISEFLYFISGEAPYTNDSPCPQLQATSVNSPQSASRSLGTLLNNCAREDAIL